MAGTPGDNDSYTNADGLVQGHAYNVLGTVTLSDGTRLVKMQNPWGSEEYHGDWSDASALWDQNPGSKEEAGWKQRNDGVFFMSYEDYWNQCSETYFNFNNSDWHSDHFLMLDDQNETPGYWGFMNGTSRHTMTLTSEVA